MAYYEPARFSRLPSDPTPARLALLCPITSQIKGYPFEVPIPDGLPVSGVILSDQVKSLDWRARNTEKAWLPAGRNHEKSSAKSKSAD